MNDACNAPGLLAVDQALSNILSNIHAITDYENKPIVDAVNYVLADDVNATMNVPICNNSAMDGYALCINEEQNQYQVIGSVFAGEIFTTPLQAGECVRIMTGAAIPENANAVVMQEKVTREANFITLDETVRLGDNIRLAGEDIRKNTPILHQGKKLKPADIGLLASIGISHVNVVRQVTVVIFSTGNELVAPGEPLPKGAIYESNRAVLIPYLHSHNYHVIDLGIIPDDQQAIEDAFLQADKLGDVVISSGGVSVGEADFTKEVLDKIGNIEFWKIAMKPGKPFAFGKLTNSHFFGLPGNPVSSMVTFMQLVLPALAKLSGQQQVNNHKLTATTTKPIKKRPGRTDFQRAIATINSSGHYIVEPLPFQGSGVLTSMSKANCFIVLNADSGSLPTNCSVQIELFEQLSNS
ncbi:molybdopterin molybdotransferase MoeA [Pseudoalteromonas shioyasakiensis]|uniref:molybdopterin molybdotransferase MoeA n=1 Tax=Pseudoalteromonas shioyasakiensis TaxID=1190813 RepID=UPI0021176814|nr:gephyrin-like molybdotransferase Glp [Pseudoalteromonas shioyasakiensis]MCQ8878783.1 molybdopterin molybdotransferase MoeA [Pseudoalteromonas shioyasakiensis]